MFPIWRKAPFIRFLIPLSAGITLQWYLNLSEVFAWSIFSFSFVVLVAHVLMHDFFRFRLSAINGIAIFMLLTGMGCLVTHFKDIRAAKEWYGHNYRPGDTVTVSVEEPPVLRANSYQVLGKLTRIIKGDTMIATKGSVIVYVQNDSALSLVYGAQIIFSNVLQQIKNSGNPGSFDYQRYCLFQGITHQVYLGKNDCVISKKTDRHFLDEKLFAVREKVLSVLQKYIHGKKEYGLAEALLIGYRDDLDKNLIQSYTNTGVVHIVAISGMHIALIYWLLALLCRPLRKINHSKWFTAAVIISGLWLFSLLAGAQASVLRSAVMFTCIVIGKNFSKQGNIYNTLAASAFILLCYNPFWLWDVGFQLSYAAVLSIVVFVKPIYNWFYVKNKLLDFVWKLNAVSISAQLLTTPFSIYHFHQFPNFFLLTNFVAVPLSSIIVLGEIFLCAGAFVPFIGTLAGKILSFLIWLMNSYIERIASLPYSVWDGMHINVVQCILLMLVVGACGTWLLEKQKTGAWIGLYSLFLFAILRSCSFRQSANQQKLIVYNIPKHEAIDVIKGRSFFFAGDSTMLTDKILQNINLRPARILSRVRSCDESVGFSAQKDMFICNSKKILVLDKSDAFDTPTKKITVDVLVISKNAILSLPDLIQAFQIRQVVLDSSVPHWKINYWASACDSLHLPYHNVSEEGAFVMNLN